MKKIKFVNKKVWEAIKKGIWQSKGLFLGLTLILICETLVSLWLPQILSLFIDNLDRKGKKWLVLCALGYCMTVILKGAVGIMNKYLSEKTGWKLCDLLRVDLFRRIFSFDVQHHKTVKEGYFLERIEGDINLLLGFFSTMLIDMAGSLLMVIGVLTAFFLRFLSLGFFLLALVVVILGMFIRSQESIARIWRQVRDAETDVLGEFSQDIAAYRDIQGTGKEKYVQEKLESEFLILAKLYEKASFWGNIPSTVFYSLLNIAEGVVLILGVYFLQRSEFTLGSIYLILSYIGLLNTPFAMLKSEFAEMPRVSAALGRITEIYEEKTETENPGKLEHVNDCSVVFDHVSFGYVPENIVLDDVSFSAKTGEHILIEGRTGSGKSTVLQLLAGFYKPSCGEILIGGNPVDAYTRNAFRNFLYYILQTNPILEDTIKNNVTRYNDRFTDTQVNEALAAVRMEGWLEQQESTH